MVVDNSVADLSPMHLPDRSGKDRPGDSPSHAGGLVHSAVHEVLLSEDILPLIITRFKNDILGLNLTASWEKAIAQLLVVSKAFFHAGIAVLWHCMDSVVPAFRLLPWFSKRHYDGIGVRYSSQDYTTMVMILSWVFSRYISTAELSIGRDSSSIRLKYDDINPIASL